jgi:hypothetical protein
LTLPQIPGYLDDSDATTLLAVWPKPSAPFPESLWPAAHIRKIVREPQGWITVSEHFYTDAECGGTGCVLADATLQHRPFDDTDWLGRELGTVEHCSDGRVTDGLQADPSEPPCEFFVKARRPAGSNVPIIDISLPFLWFWDAYPIENGW